MKIISDGDAYADALSTAALGTLPFIAIGYLKHPVVLYVSGVLGILFSGLFLIRFVMLMRSDCARQSQRLDRLVSTMQMPYAIALLSYIFIDGGYEMEPGLWISLALAIGGILFVLLDNDDF